MAWDSAYPLDSPWVCAQVSLWVLAEGWREVKGEESPGQWGYICRCGQSWPAGAGGAGEWEREVEPVKGALKAWGAQSGAAGAPLGCWAQGWLGR